MAISKKKASKVLPFNRKNVLALADRIYSDKGGELKVLKLCSGTLMNGPDGGRTLHCAVGELYYNFVSQRVTKCIANNDTDTAINELVAEAQLKKPDPLGDLESALSHCVSSNDSVSHTETVSSFIERSQKVAEVLRMEIAPLLK